MELEFSRGRQIARSIYCRRKATLADIEQVFRRQLVKLRYDIIPAQRCHISRDRESRLTFAVINLLNSWSNFVRAFYLSCAFGAKTKTLVFVRPHVPFSDTNAAIGYAIQQFKRYASPNILGRWHRRDEPPWHDPNTLLRVCANLRFSNTTKIQAAFSLNLRVFLDLPVARNFYAHRNQGTDEAAQLLAPLYGIPSNLRVTQLLFSNPLRRPQPLIFEWIDELKITADFLCD